MHKQKYIKIYFTITIIFIFECHSSTIMFVYSAVECGCKIRNHLKSVEVIKGETTVLRVSISKPNKAFWFKDEEALKTDNRYRVNVSNDGLMLSLTIEDICAEDGGNYSVNIEDGRGIVTSSCQITVRGMQFKRLPQDNLA